MRCNCVWATDPGGRGRGLRWQRNVCWAEASVPLDLTMAFLPRFAAPRSDTSPARSGAPCLGSALSEARLSDGVCALPIERLLQPDAVVRKFRHASITRRPEPVQPIISCPAARRTRCTGRIPGSIGNAPRPWIRPLSSGRCWLLPLVQEGGA